MIRCCGLVLLGLLLGLAMVVGAPCRAEALVTGIPVIVDTDMAPDDWMALLFLLKHPAVDVRAITIVGTGEAHCRPGVENALNLVTLVTERNIPVACGRETPLVGQHAFPSSWRRYADRLAGLTVPKSPHTGFGKTAIDLLTEIAQTCSRQLRLIALGPLTNIAEALQQVPALKEKIEMIYIMGGALDVPGNVQTSSPTGEGSFSEWNMYIDPRAAEIVLESGIPITLVPLDCTNSAPVTEAFYNRLGDNRATPAADFVFRLLTTMLFMIRSGDQFFWDVLASAIAVDETLASVSWRSVKVVTVEGPECGRTKPGAGGSVIRVCVHPDVPRFETLFLETLLTGSTPSR